MALDEWSFSKLTHSHCSQSLWPPCGPGPAVTFATDSFLAPVDGPEVGDVIHMRMGESSAVLSLCSSRLRRP